MLLHNLIGIHRHHRLAHAADARVLQDAVDEAVHAPRPLTQQTQVLFAFGVELFRLVGADPVGERADRAQRCLQIMGDDVGKILQLLVCALQFANQERLAFFRLLAEADVVHQAGEHAAAVHLHFAHRQLDREGGAVLALRDHLAAEADDALLASGQIVREIAVVLFMVGGRHELGDVFAQHFVPRIAEQALGGGIEGVDGAAFVDGNDGVHRRLHDGGKSRALLIQRILGPLAPGDVMHRSQYIAVFQRTQADIRRELAAVLAQAVQLNPAVHDAAVGVCRIVLALRDMGGAKTRWNQAFDRQREQFGPRIAEQRFGGRVGQHDASARIGDKHGIGCRFQQPQQAFLFLAFYESPPLAFRAVMKDSHKLNLFY